MQRIIIIVLAAILIQSCNLNTTGTWKNKNVDRRKKEEIKSLNDKLFKAINNNDVAVFTEIMSDSINVNMDMDKQLDDLHHSLKTDNYKVLEEYNVVSASAGARNNLISDELADNSYEANYQAPNKETYTSLLLTSDKDNEQLILLVYGKYGEEWKVNIFQYGQYRLLGKTAPEYFKLSQMSYLKGHLMNAMSYITIARQLLHPVNDFFRFKKEAEINEFYKKVMTEANAKFPLPLTLENVETKPKIYKMVPQVTADGFFPMLYYVSSININDEAALKLENEKVKKEISRLFQGIEEEKKYIFYWVSNESPDAGKVAEQYGFVDTLSASN